MSYEPANPRDYEEDMDDDDPDYEDPKTQNDKKREAAQEALDLFEEILDAAERIDWDSREGRESFEQMYREKFQLTNEDHGTLLHNFVTSRSKSKPLLFVRWLVRRCPQLIKVVDVEQKTPLHLALDPRYHYPEFVDTVLANFPEDDTLATALGMQDTGGKNCLHHAISQRFQLTLKLIEKCGPGTFTQYNNDGKTPLLMAMDVDCLHRRRPQPTRAQQLPKKRQEKSNGYINGDDVDSKRDKTAPSIKTLPAKSDPKDRDRLLEKKEALINKSAAKDTDRASSPPRRKQEASRTGSSSMTAHIFYLPDVVQSLMEKSEKSLEEVTRGNLPGKTPYQYRLFLLSKVNANQDIVAQVMKEFCLRKLPRDKAITILYEQGKEKHIEFDLSSLPTLPDESSPSISQKDLFRLSRHLTFEDTLMYVALPRLRVVEDYTSPPALSAPPAPPGSSTPNNDLRDKPSIDLERSGRSDVKFIFQWLWKNRVRRIFKVIVIDDGEIPHSEEAIADALKLFRIEIWDWKKTDICSETIVSAAQDHVKIVYLYSSGNNAVLRGWSCPTGLVKLKLLEEVHLIIRRGFETESRRDKDVKQFEKTFLENWQNLYSTKKLPVVKVIRDDKPKSYASGFELNTLPEEKQDWLIHMDIFATFIRNIRLEEEKEKRIKKQQEAKIHGASDDEMPPLLEDIRVAVIDDGINGFEDDLSESIAHGVSYSGTSDADKLIRSYYLSSGGHGTMMARLIRRICPGVKLYVARLEEYRSSNKRFITARSATKAIHWAITNKVHIISMSWSIEGGEQQEIKDLKKAIEKAKAANIIMFCAFSDQGTNSSENAFPCAWRKDCEALMAIGAATARGDPSTLVDKERVDFLFPGEQIVIDSKDSDTSLVSTPPKAENGSSISTALATGTAALILFLAQLVRPEFYLKLQQPGRMKSAFGKFCLGTNSKYFNAQAHFEKRFDTDPNLQWHIDGKKWVEVLIDKLITRTEELESKNLM